MTLRELREARDALLSGAAEPGPKPRKPAIMIDLRAVRHRGAASALMTSFLTCRSRVGPAR